ncbi:hypothetical protein EXIGLDRAFT_729440 [Exidia glandulosa HHB12029]|uniref:Extracellular membrane protein CFEM domain-containing protein n=1 Tax=Exidia glandulosa HHB12029 TaxID=1314781 RepID=A0A165LJ96_EXIGL|nr:hypothetical protein EXIGLDRAFT_729440 [Exidia glandulosa HHB12029]
MRTTFLSILPFVLGVLAQDIDPSIEKSANCIAQCMDQSARSDLSHWEACTTGGGVDDPHCICKDNTIKSSVEGCLKAACPDAVQQWESLYCSTGTSDDTSAPNPAQTDSNSKGSAARLAACAGSIAVGIGAGIALLGAMN